MRFFKFLFLLALIAAAAVGYYFYLPYGPQQETFVDILPGTGTQAMAQQLQKAGIIRSQYALEAMKLVHGGALKAGEYRFDHPVTLIEIYKRLRKGDVYTRTLVIKEGFNIFDIAQAVEAAGLGSHTDFLAAEKANTALIAKWSANATSLEGYLFPDTYRFSRHASSTNILATMVKRFDQQIGRLGGVDRTDISRLVTMASLVEREVHIDSERPIVAGVFENRLAANMPLQTDPAVVYASQLRGTWTGAIHQSELHADSPYNTYLHPGLPPGPICNPGLAALKAALHPAQTDFLYFVADANGATKFSRTIQEHNQNVSAYRATAH